MSTPTQNSSNLRSKLRWGIAGIFGLLIVCSIFVVPEFFNKGIVRFNELTNLQINQITVKPYRLGLDLQGGVQLVYEANVKQIDANKQAQAVEGVRDVIERRVNGMGVGEPNVQTSHIENAYRINVELPGLTDVNQAIKMIGETPILEFKEQNTAPARDLTAEEQKEMNAFNDAAKKQAADVLKRIKSGEKFEELAKQLSQDDTSKNNGGYLNYINSKFPTAGIYDWALKAKNGELSTEPVLSVDGYNILKRGADRAGVEEIKASHILICYLGSKGCAAQITKDEALTKAKEIFAKATAANFAQLAKENSTDGSNKDKGGDLGYTAKGTFVPEFENALLAAKNGDIVGPVESPFGYHIIYRTDSRVSKEIEVSRILVKIKTAEDIVPPPEAWKTTGLSGKQLDHAEVVTDQRTGEVQVSLKFNAEGTTLFKDITTRNINKPVAIFLDNKAISTPRVNSIIADGSAVISGGFTVSDASLLAQRLNAGALPVPVELASQQAIGATLGAESLHKSLIAGMVGTILVMLFMLVIYRLPGLLSVISLCLYIVLTLSIFKIIGVTITLAGIAGFIMSLGVAVDANVLIFERLREELARGKSLKTGVEEGFTRAWTSIRDGNASTLITCVILIWFGTSFVKGFAVTLALGVLVSLFTAITVTRVMLRFVVPWFKNPQGTWWMLAKRKPKN